MDNNAQSKCHLKPVVKVPQIGRHPSICSRVDVDALPVFCVVLTASILSKSSLKAQSVRRGLSSEMEESVSRNCSADPSGMSGFSICASRIFVFSSSVGIIVCRIFCREGNTPSDKKALNRKYINCDELHKIKQPSRCSGSFCRGTSNDPIFVP